MAGKGTRFTEEERYTGIMSKELGGEFVLVEEGLNGRTTAFSDRMEPERCAIDHIMPILLSQLPLDYMIIMLGTNDTKSHFNVNAMEIGYGMEELLVKVLHILKRWNSEAKVILIAPLPIHPINDSMFDENSANKSKELAEVYEPLADTYGCYFLDAGKLGMELGVDGIHLKQESHSILGKELAGFIKKLEE